MKALDDYILVVLFVLFLKRVHSSKRNLGITTQMKVLDDYILVVLFVLFLKRVHSSKRNLKV